MIGFFICDLEGTSDTYMFFNLSIIGDYEQILDSV